MEVDEAFFVGAAHGAEGWLSGAGRARTAFGRGSGRGHQEQWTNSGAKTRMSAARQVGGLGMVASLGRNRVNLPTAHALSISPQELLRIDQLRRCLYMQYTVHNPHV